MPLHADECEGLAPPPRTVPLGLRWHVLSRALLGPSIFFAFTWLFALPGFLQLNLLSEWRLAQSRRQVQGQLTGRGQQTELFCSFQYYQYCFPLPDGTIQHGVSYGKQPELEKARQGAAIFNFKVAIEYNPDYPRASRILGTSAGNFAFQTLFFLIFPITAFILLVERVRGALGKIHLLRHGMPARATITTCFTYRDSDEKTPALPVEEFKQQWQADRAKHNKSLAEFIPQVSCNFDVHLPDGQIIHGCDTSSLDTGQGATPPVPVLYDPARPQRARFVENLGPSMRVAPTGEWEVAVTPARTCLVLLLVMCCLLWPWCVWAWTEFA
jgi:hypothetical protein